MRNRKAQKAIKQVHLITVASTFVWSETHTHTHTQPRAVYFAMKDRAKRNQLATIRHHKWPRKICVCWNGVFEPDRGAGPYGQVIKVRGWREKREEAQIPSRGWGKSRNE